MVDSKWPGGSKAVVGEYEFALEPELLRLNGSSNCSQQGILTVRVALPLRVRPNAARTVWLVSATNLNPTFKTNVTLAVEANTNLLEPLLSFTMRVEAPGVGTNELLAELRKNDSRSYRKFELKGALTIEHSKFYVANFLYTHESERIMDCSRIINIVSTFVHVQY